MATMTLMTPEQEAFVIDLIRENWGDCEPGDTCTNCGDLAKTLMGEAPVCSADCARATAEAWAMDASGEEECLSAIIIMNELIEFDSIASHSPNSPRWMAVENARRLYEVEPEASTYTIVKLEAWAAERDKDWDDDECAAYIIQFLKTFRLHARSEADR